MSCPTGPSVAERVGLEIGSGARVEWDLGSLLRSADSADSTAAEAWELVGEVDWERIGSLRLMSASFGEDALAVAVARPAGAETPETDEVAVAYVSPTGAERPGDALVSTEYDADDRVRRVGLELWGGVAGARRVAADRSGDPVATEAEGVRREVTPMDFRADGERGPGLHELLRPA